MDRSVDSVDRGSVFSGYSVKLQCSTEEGKRFWFELSGGSKI